MGTVRLPAKNKKVKALWNSKTKRKTKNRLSRSSRTQQITKADSPQVAIKVIVLGVHRVRVFTNRHAPIIRVVSIAEKVKTRVVSVPRVLVQACRAAHHSPEENMVSHAVAAIVLVPVIIKEEKKAAISLVAAISPVVATSLVLKENMVSRVAAISLVAVISPVVATSRVAVISLVSRVVTSRVVAISLVSRVATLLSVVAMVPSVVVSRNSVAAMIPMLSIR